MDHKAWLTNLLSAIHTEAFLHFSLYPACSHLWLVFTLAPLSNIQLQLGWESLHFSIDITAWYIFLLALAKMCEICSVGDTA